MLGFIGTLVKKRADFERYHVNKFFYSFGFIKLYLFNTYAQVIEYAVFHYANMSILKNK